MDRSDRSFIERAVREHSGMVYRIACHNVPSAEDAKDVVQEVCLRLVRRGDKAFESREHLKAWLIRATLHVAADKRKTDARWRKCCAVGLRLPGARDEEVRQALSELDADTLYTIVAEYVYDLHNGAGAREAEASAEVRTALHEVTLVGVTPLMDSGGAVLADENVMLDIRYSTESRIVPKSFVVNGQTCPAVVNEDGRSVVYYVPSAGADEIVVDVTDVQYTHNGVAVKSVVNSSADGLPDLAWRTAV